MTYNVSMGTLNPTIPYHTNVTQSCITHQLLGKTRKTQTNQTTCSLSCLIWCVLYFYWSCNAWGIKLVIFGN